MQSRYYNPEVGRFLNSDTLVATGQGMLGNNMLAYCRNNPVRRRDIPGTTDVDIFDDGDANLLDDDKEISGGKMGSASSGKSSSSSAPKPNASIGGQSPQKTNDPGSNSTSSKIRTPDQQALHDLAREIERDAKQGKFISYEDAQLLDSWAKEYGVYQRHGAIIGSGEHWRTGWDHTHIYNIHVPFATYR